MLFDKILPPAKVHMLGIGGISMSGLAEILKNKGYTVSGSDINHTHITDKLESSGINVIYEHNAENVINKNAVIYTASIKPDNPEYQKAIELDIPLIERSVLLGEITKMFSDTIAISGTHGKTTTTSMISVVFLNAQKDPTIAVGGELPEINSNYKIGNSQYLITEACEYVDSFLKLFPKISIVLNIEEDHLDYFKDINQIKKSFRNFLSLLPKDGLAVVNADDTNCMEVINDTDAPIVTVGIDNNATFMAKNIDFSNGNAEFDLYKNGEFVSAITLAIPGKHNIYDALSCIAVADFYNIDIEVIKSSLASFRGAKRRFELKGSFNGADIYDDYAHHPSEIKATLNAAKAKGKNKVICVFQPHTYTRTKLLLDEFATAFEKADEVIITDIYAAREKDTGDIHSKDLVAKVNEYSHNAKYIKDFEEIESYVKENISQGDLFFTIGAGNVFKIGENILGASHR